MTLKTRFLIGTALLCLVDIVMPLPLVGLALIGIVFQKPPWFQKMVAELYET